MRNSNPLVQEIFEYIIIQEQQQLAREKQSNSIKLQVKNLENEVVMALALQKQLEMYAMHVNTAGQKNYKT